MRIGEVAAAAGLTTRAVRYYEQRGLLTARRATSGHRRYEPADVDWLRSIREMLATGLTIEDVRTLVDAWRVSVEPAGGPPPDLTAGSETCPLPRTVIRRRLADLDARIDRLTRLRDTLAERAGEPLRALVRDYPGTRC
ncbi:MerR family transcriptional regulator [Streptomyces mayteni]